MQRPMGRLIWQALAAFFRGLGYGAARRFYRRFWP